MSKTAFLFPGQASQKVGMGADLYETFAVAREVFEMAEAVSELDITRLCFKGPMDALTETINLQPAITAVNLALWAVIEKAGVKCNFCAGHSLGEYSALHAAGFISREDALRFVFKRGQLMHREATRYQGAMSAIVGLSAQELQELIEEGQKTGIVALANHNTETQIVITGSPDAVAQVSEKAAAKGARAIPLKVSGAWHSELIKGAEAEFAEFLSDQPFTTPKGAIVHNVTAEVSRDPKTSQEIMARQLCSPVRWYDSMCRLMDEGVNVFVEVGPGRVLTGLLKQILPRDYACRFYNLNDVTSLEAFLNREK